MRRREWVLTMLALAVPAAAHDDEEPALSRTALIHGAAGPFAVAGYRMGEAALETLGLKRGSFDMEVTHYAPAEVQWSCVIDGLQAATGASLGKMNLTLQPAMRAEMRSVVRNKKTGQAVELRLTPAFVREHLNLPQDQLLPAGQKLADAKAETIFTSRSVR